MHRSCRAAIWTAVLWTAVLWTAASLPAQDPALRDTRSVLPAYRPFANAQAMVDLDGDGLDDLIVVHADRSIVWLATPEGAFVERADDAPGAGAPCKAIAAGDLDGDGDADVVVVAEQWSGFFVRVLRNDGTGLLTLAPAHVLPGALLGTCVAIGDVDGDGDQDVVLGGPAPSPLPPPWVFPGQVLELFLNQGAGTFVDATASLPAVIGMRALAVTLFDQDGDGDLDLHVAVEQSSLNGGEVLLRNSGAGTFTAVPMASAASGRTVRMVAVMDVDGDQWPDLLEMTTGTGPHRLHAAQNDGAGNFVHMTLPQVPNGGAVDDLLVGDWQGDGAMDFGVRSVGALHRFVRTQPAVFQHLPQTLGVGNRRVHAFDLDGDGDSDVLAPSAAINASVALVADLFRNVQGAFERLPAPSPALPVGSNYVVRLVDLDGDGFLDLVQAPFQSSGSGHGGLIWRGDGAGGFTPANAGDFGLVVVFGRGLAFGDVDGDGDLDIVCASRPEPGPAGMHDTRLYLQQNGTFVAAPFPALQGECPLLADLDGDSDLDCVLVDWASGQVLLNDGTGAFTVAGALPVTGGPSTPLAPAVIADFDSDGDPDVVTRNGVLLRNNGAGGFTAQSLGASFQGEVVAADFDQDQDVDLVFEWSSTTNSACLLRNQGGGTFVTVALPSLGNVALTQIHAADVDLDGWMDLIVTNLGGEWAGAYGVLRNNQLGGFTLLPDGLPDAPDSLFTGAVGDVDGDGDVDLVVAGPPGLALYRNLHHQLARRGLPRIGRTLGLDLHGRAGEPYILGFALAKNPVELPGFGVLWLDLASLQVFAFGFHGPDGYTPFTAPLPNVPAVVGLELHWQALQGVVGRLGNVETTTLLAH